MNPDGGDQPPPSMAGPRRLTLTIRGVGGSLRQVGDRSYLVKWLPVATAIGMVAGLGAIALHGLLSLVTAGVLGGLAGYTPAGVAADHEAGVASPVAHPWSLPVLVAAGALISSMLVRLLAPETKGHGTDAAIDAIHHNPKGIRGRVTVVKLAASALLLGSGGSGGTEGPAAQMSAAFGSVLARAFRLSTAEARIAVSAGLASGVGAIFRAPLGGALLGAELPYRRDLAGAALVPSLIASVVAYVEFGLVYGFGPTLGEHNVSLGSVAELPLFLVLGLCAGLAARGFSRFFYRTISVFDGWRRMPVVLRPAIAGLAVGAVGVLLPDVLGTSYGLMQAALDPGWLLDHAWWVLLLLPLAKLVTTSLSVGSGGSGGVFGPAMVIGALVGAVFWRLVDAVGIPVPGPALFVIAGMAACLGAAIHAPVAVTVMAVEMTGAAGAVLPTMVAVVVATLVMGRDGLYRSQLDDRTPPPAPVAQPVGGPVIASDVVDLTRLPLSELRALDGSALSHAIRRVQRELADPPQSLAAFTNGTGTL